MLSNSSDSGVRDYSGKYSIYKPTRSVSGAAVQFDFNCSKKSVFVEAAKQVPVPAGSTAQHAFDWGNKLVFKLASTDLGKLLVVLEAKSKSAELFHDPGKGGYSLSAEVKNSALSLSKGDYGFFFKLSSQARESGVYAVTLGISEDEATVLRILFTRAIEASYGW